MRKVLAFASAAILLVLAACGGGLNARWNGTGERAEARFFSFALNFTNLDKPYADFQYKNGEVTRLAVCALTQKEGHVEFKMDPDAKAETCDALKSPLIFVGDFGLDVLTGQALDGTGRRAGVFRAFRVGG